MEERRSSRRFNLLLTSVVSAYDRDGYVHCELVTDNISAGGAYFCTPYPYAVGTHVSLQIMIRRNGNSSFPSHGACVNVRGEVVRTDASGIAVEFDDQYHMVQIPPETVERSAGICGGKAMDVQNDQSNINTNGGLRICNPTNQ
jgi:PilZ domain